MQNQLGLFTNNQTEPMRWIMLSLQPQYYKQVCQGLKKTEYRRGAFINKPCHCFIYCSTPVAEVGVYVRLGQPVISTPEHIAQIKEAEEAGSYNMMLDWLAGSKQATAIPVEDVKTFPAITLEALRHKLGKFHPPQRYTYLDKKPELLELLKNQSGLSF